MHIVRVVESGILFETGTPVTFRYVRNTAKAPFFGSTYQQDIEPAGVYVVHNEDPGDLARGWDAGIMALQSPLVLAFNEIPGQLYDETSWKAVLRDTYRATGRKLSRRLLADGYDGVVTVMLNDKGRPLDTREIVALRH